MLRQPEMPAVLLAHTVSLVGTVAAQVALPGIAADVVDDEAHPVPNGGGGYLVLATQSPAPVAPSPNLRASRSRFGVSPRVEPRKPMRSARVVSSVISRMFGWPSLIAACTISWSSSTSIALAGEQ